MSKSNSKLRKVYKRNGVVHVCFNGAYFAPEDSETTEVTVGGGVKAKVLDEEAGTIEVFQPVPKKKGVREVWQLTDVPRGKRRGKQAA